MSYPPSSFPSSDPLQTPTKSRWSNYSEVGFDAIDLEGDRLAGATSSSNSKHSDPWREASSSTSPSQSLGSSGKSFKPQYSSTLGNYTPASPVTISCKGSVSSGVPLVLGVAVVDFNHLIGPTVEFAYPPALQSAVSDDEDLNRLLPFLALPDGAHLSEEDYSYFHCTYKPSNNPGVETNVPPGQTLFGISCNRQLSSADLLRRPSDVTRSTVQKAVIVIASQPVFGPIRDRLGVVTRAYFAQKDFTQTQILEDFYKSLESSLEGKAGEGAIYMGTSLRELIHKFRHKTLILLKMLMLQKRILLFGYPVEMLCTYQYSLVSLMPGLLMNLQDSGDPQLDLYKTKSRPTSLRTSDRASLLRYMGLRELPPGVNRKSTCALHIFGQGAFFQPYLPLQQIETLKARSWLAGTTNQIVTQQRDCKYDLMVNIEHTTFEFTDSKLERLVALTPSDRRWMDDVVKTVEDTWVSEPGHRAELAFRGSDDDLRSRFEEYICAALSSIKYAEFIVKGRAQDVAIVGVAAEQNVLAPFSEAWLTAFKATPAFETWNAVTDPVLFDLCEPRHPCDGKVTTVSDLGLRLAEGLHDLRLDEQLAPTREALSSAFAAGSSTLFKAFDGVRSEVSNRLKDRESSTTTISGTSGRASPSNQMRPLSTSSAASTISSTPPQPASGVLGGIGTSTQFAEIGATLGGIGKGLGSFFGGKVASLQARSGGGGGGTATAQGNGLRPMTLSPGHGNSALRPGQQ